jgi:two-component system, OmpR family, response regulator
VSQKEVGTDSAVGSLSAKAEDLSILRGATISLSRGDYALLLAYLEAPQRSLTREHLLQATRIHEDIFDRSIDVRVLRLRRKLERDPRAPRAIQTERGIGYLFTLPVEPY